MSYVCEWEEPFAQWISDGVLHQRGAILHNEYRSDEPRVTGSELGYGHLDVDLTTGNIYMWGHTTLVTSEGTWFTDMVGELTAEGGWSRVTGYGGDGLEGYFISWDGVQLAPPYEDPPCDPVMVVQMTGVIRPGRGPEP
jgi:succinyl-CoA synthetase alpha subunit